MLPNRPQSPIKRQLEVHNPQNCKGNSTPESDPVAARSACRRGQVSLSLSGLRIGLPSVTGVKCEPALWWWEGGGVAASYAIVIHTFLLLLLLWTHPHVLFLSLLSYVVFLHVSLCPLQSPCRQSLKGCPLIFLMVWKGLLSVRLQHNIHN